MSASASSRYAEIVATLRSAGCVFAEGEARVLLAAAPSPADLAAMVESRTTGLPLEQIVGYAEFCGLRIAVEPGVFVPRRRSEFLVQQAAELARASQAAVLVDLCAGSGALTAALVAALGKVTVHAVDLDPAAVRCARTNLAGNGTAYQGDLYEPLPASLRGRVDVLVVNAPYVPTDELELMPAEARVHEPRHALDGGADGLDVHRRVAAEATDWLAADGHLLIETSERQAPLAVAMFDRCGLTSRVVYSDDYGATVVTASRRSASLHLGASDVDSPCGSDQSGTD